ncbi:MAG: hypothetical protein R3C59_13310 [Planctomycetaceae bacterium]
MQNFSNINRRTSRQSALRRCLSQQARCVGMMIVLSMVLGFDAVAQDSRPVDFPSFEELMQPGGALPMPQRSPGSDRLALPRSLNESEPIGSSRADFVIPNPGPDRRTERFVPGSSRPGNDRVRTDNYGGFLNTDPVSQSRSLDDRSRENQRFNDRSTDNRSESRGLPYRRDERGDVRSGDGSRIDEYRDNTQSLGRMQIVEAEASSTVESVFDWNGKTTSIADLRFPTATVFAHNDDFMTLPEEEAYLDLMAAVERQKQLLLKQSRQDRSSGDDPTAIWEEAFYQYPRARQLAWNNGQLRKAAAIPTVNGLADPFRSANADVAVDQTSKEYRVLDDISRFPQDFVGRPIILYGRFTAESEVRLLPGKKSASAAFDDRFAFDSGFEQASGQPQVGARIEDERFAVDSGDPDTGLVRTEQRLLRGTLIGLTGTKQLAIVDTRGLVTPSSGLQGINEAWRNEGAIPVMIKGWVVKQWKSDRPLIYCESMRLITPRPHTDLIVAHTVDKRRLRDDETWLYYETLNQLKLTSPVLQMEIAGVVQKQRIDSLMAEIMEKSTADLKSLAAQHQSGGIDETTFQRRKGSLQRRLDQRLERYRTYRRNPDDFPTYVDLFQNPDKWQGHLVTLTGHVRHVVSYAGDEMMFGGQRLHELWLFTDDSQHNPAVIVTPELPADFPKDADVINCVSVTGCFFKRYVYGSQDTSRIAPLILAESVRWQPTVDQVQMLIAEGHLSKGSPRAVRAAAIAGDRTSDAVVLAITFCVVLGMMVMWGRAQREERDRVRLRRVVNEVPVFENPALDSYSSLLHDDRYVVDSLLADTPLPDFRRRS